MEVDKDAGVPIRPKAGKWDPDNLFQGAPTGIPTDPAANLERLIRESRPGSAVHLMTTEPPAPIGGALEDAIVGMATAGDTDSIKSLVVRCGGADN